MKEAPCRFCRLYAIWLVVFSMLIGVMLTLQAGLGLDRLAAVTYLTRVLTLDVVQSVGSAVSGSALLLALIIWSQPLAPSDAIAQLPRMLKRALLVSLIGYPVAVLLSLAASVLTARLAFHIPLVPLASLSLSMVGVRHVAIGVLTMLVDTGLIVFVAWRAMPRLLRSNFSLPAKLAIAWTVSFMLRAIVGLTVYSLFTSR